MAKTIANLGWISMGEQNLENPEVQFWTWITGQTDLKVLTKCDAVLPCVTQSGSGVVLLAKNSDCFTYCLLSVVLQILFEDGSKLHKSRHEIYTLSEELPKKVKQKLVISLSPVFMLTTRLKAKRPLLSTQG